MTRSFSASRSARGSRRAAAALLLALLPLFAAAQEGRRSPILTVDRARVLAEAEAARTVAAAKDAAEAELQSRIDAIRAELAEEEEALSELRQTMERGAFDARVEAFKTRVQTERRRAQRRAAILDRLFQEARAHIAAQLDPVLSQILLMRGALVILDLDDVAAARPGIDVTAEAIRRFDDQVAAPELPPIEALFSEDRLPGAPETP